MEIAGIVVVVTGGGSGIGAAMARRFAAAGAAGVVVADLNGEAAQAVAREVGGLGLATDVADEAQTLDLLAAAEQRYGPVDLFCANAGIGVPGGVELPDAVWQRMWQVNVMAHVHAARALVPRMLARAGQGPQGHQDQNGHTGQKGGHLLFTASAAGLLAQFDAPYSVTKHAAVAHAEWLSITYGDRIGVSCLCPLGVDTPMLQAETPRRRGLMSQRVLSADDVAEAVLRGVQADEFLILPHEETWAYVQSRSADHARWLRGMRRLHAQAAEPGA